LQQTKEVYLNMTKNMNKNKPLQKLTPRKTSVDAGSTSQAHSSIGMGIGFVKPPNMTNTELAELVSIWREKLADSGFKDIEIHVPGASGKVIPFFSYGGSAADISRLYDPFVAEYYNLCRSFSTTFDFAKHFKSAAKLNRYIWDLHTEGVPHRHIKDALEGKTLKYPYQNYVKKLPKTIKGIYPLSFVSKSIKNLTQAFNKWRAEQELLEAQLLGNSD
jgi:hypothetical protein